MVESFFVAQRISEEGRKHFVSLVCFLSAFGFSCVRLFFNS